MYYMSLYRCVIVLICMKCARTYSVYFYHTSPSKVAPWTLEEHYTCTMVTFESNTRAWTALMLAYRLSCLQITCTQSRSRDSRSPAVLEANLCSLACNGNFKASTKLYALCTCTYNHVHAHVHVCTRSGPHEVEIVGFLLFCRLFVAMYQQFDSIHEDLISKKSVG